MTDVTDLNTQRLARLAAHGLRRALVAGGESELPPAEELAALAADRNEVRVGAHVRLQHILLEPLRNLLDRPQRLGEPAGRTGS